VIRIPEERETVGKKVEPIEEPNKTLNTTAVGKLFQANTQPIFSGKTAYKGGKFYCKKDLY